MSQKRRALKRAIAKARLWAKEERWDEEAVALNTNILKKAPDRVGAYIRRGRCYLEMGMLAEAEKNLRIALEKDPQNREARALLRRAEDSSGSKRTEDWRELIEAVLEGLNSTLRSTEPPPSATRPKLPVSAYTGSGTHSVYVVELDPEVLERSRFRDENPYYVSGRPCVYVGRTGHTPEERFRNHKLGYKASKYVRDFGRKLMPELYQHLNPMPFEEVKRMERELTRVLRAAGYAVWSC